MGLIVKLGDEKSNQHSFPSGRANHDESPRLSCNFMDIDTASICTVFGAISYGVDY